MTRSLLLLALTASLAAANSFPAPPDTQETDLKLPTAAESLAGITLPKGFRATVFAAEPDVRQPIAMTFDDRGRLWVAECYTYADRKVNYDLDLRDRIVIFEDADGDGRFDGNLDKRTVFHDDLQRLTGIALGFGGVWVTTAPDLLFIPDENRDDKPDAEPVVLLDGWNTGKVRHNIVNGLKWGPDGWLYGRHGIQDVSKVGKPGTPEEERTPLRCCIWRYHPTRETFELVTEGTTNSWGHDWDQHGQLFFINTVIGHLWHAVPGAYFKRMHGRHFNPHLYELIEQTADHFHWDTGFKWSKARKLEGSTHDKGGGHAHCGMMIYQGDDWPDKYRHQLFTVNLLGRRVNRDSIERSGAGYLGKHEPDFLSANDPWFRGIELDYSFDGSVYLLDWSDVGECHENDGVHRSSGRIFRITWGITTHKPFDLAALPSETLANLQLEKNERYVRHARRLLQERSHAGKDLSAAKKILAATFADNPDVTRKLRALWSLHAIGATGSDSPFAPLRLLEHKEEHVRVWAIRLLADDGAAPSPEACDALAKLAAKEKSGLVRLYLASALRRLPHEKRWPLATALAQSADLAEDPAFPLLLWYGIEPAVAENPTAALKLAAASKLSKLRQFIPRRLAEQRK